MILTYDTDSREVITKDKKKLVLDNYAVWKIFNPALFYTSLGNERSANTKLMILFTQSSMKKSEKWTPM